MSEEKLKYGGTVDLDTVMVPQSMSLVPILPWKRFGEEFPDSGEEVYVLSEEWGDICECLVGAGSIQIQMREGIGWRCGAPFEPDSEDQWIPKSTLLATVPRI